MKIHQVSNKELCHGGRVCGFPIVVGFIVFSMIIPLGSWANMLLVQDELPKPAPSPKESPLGLDEFDIRKPPSFLPKTPAFSLGNQEDVGVFLDKQRQGFGFQWDPGGNIPGVDLGLESHNLYSLNRMFPRDEPYPAWTPQSDSQYFGQPPTAPDHSGAFLRFRW